MDRKDSSGRARGGARNARARARGGGANAKHSATKDKKTWFAEVMAVDSDALRAENRERAKASPATTGWSALIAECRACLDVDITALCEELDLLHKGCLPVGMQHLFDERVNGHFTNHQCCALEPPDPVCAVARALFVFGQAARALRPEAWRRTLRQELVSKRGYEQAQEADYLRLVEQLKEAMRSDADEQLAKVDLWRRLEKLAGASQLRRLYLEQVLRKLKGPLALIGPRDNARPALVLAESELMRGGHYKPRDVAGLIKDERNESDPRRQVQRRMVELQWTLSLSLRR